jgi:hypothetical protein
MNILKFFGIEARHCDICGQTAFPGHACEQPARWSRRGFLFLMAATPLVAKVLPETDPRHGFPETWPEISDRILALTKAIPQEMTLFRRLHLRTYGNARKSLDSVASISATLRNP